MGLDLTPGCIGSVLGGKRCFRQVVQLAIRLDFSQQELCRLEKGISNA